MINTVALKKRDLSLLPKILLLVVSVFLSSYIISSLNSIRIEDWTVFYNAPLSNPYSKPSFLSPYWLRLVISPFTLVGEDFGFYLFLASSILLLSYLLKDNKLKIIIVLLSPFFLDLVKNGQIDILIIIGYLLLKQDNLLGIPFILAKPQVLLGSFISYFLNTNLKNKIMISLVCGLLLFVGFILYGNWVMDMYRNITGPGLIRGASVTEYFHSVPLGILIFIIGVYKKNMCISGISTIFITPYIAFHSLIAIFAIIIIEIENKYLLILLLIFSWIPIVYLLVQ